MKAADKRYIYKIQGRRYKHICIAKGILNCWGRELLIQCFPLCHTVQYFVKNFESIYYNNYNDKSHPSFYKENYRKSHLKRFENIKKYSHI